MSQYIEISERNESTILDGRFSLSSFSPLQKERKREREKERKRVREKERKRERQDLQS